MTSVSNYICQRTQKEHTHAQKPNNYIRSTIADGTRAQKGEHKRQAETDGKHVPKINKRKGETNSEGEQ